MFQGILISLTGFLVVFIMLFTLYLAVNLLKILSNKKERDISDSPSNHDKVSDESDDLAAVMAAISILMEGKSYKVNRIFLNDDSRILWSKEKWQNLYCGRGPK